MGLVAAHTPLALSFLAIMVLFLILVGVIHIRLLNRLALRITYLEGTLDMILQSQEQTMKLIARIVDK